MSALRALLVPALPASVMPLPRPVHGLPAAAALPAHRWPGGHDQTL